MPPKSQTKSFLQSPPRTFAGQAPVLFEYGQLSHDYSNQSSAVEVGTFPEVERSADPVPVSAKAAPEHPQVTTKSVSTLQIKQLWEGTVTELRGETFMAILSDKSQPNNPQEQVEFESVELRDDDLPLVAEGAVFYWMIGTERTPAGQVRNVSNIEFSRLPVWTRSSLRVASDKAASVEEWFQENGSHPA